MMFLAQYDVPGLPEITLWPVILAAVGIAIWYFGWRFEKDGANPLFKWAGILPLAISAILAWHYFRLSIDTGFDGTAFRDSIGNSKRLIYSAYFAFLLPFVSMLGFVAWFFIDKQLSKYR